MHVRQQVEAKHKKLSGLLVSLSIPKWKWGHVAMDFFLGHRRDSMQYGWWLIDSPILAQRPITLFLMMINSCSYSTNDLVFI